MSTCHHAGGLPGPTFQALPEPAPLPPLPRPAPQLQTMPAEAMAAMAPMSAMAGEAQPGAQLQVCSLTPRLCQFQSKHPVSVLVWMLSATCVAVRLKRADDLAFMQWQVYEVAHMCESHTLTLDVCRRARLRATTTTCPTLAPTAAAACSRAPREPSQRRPPSPTLQ